ncbi:PAC2 family-domain-containing protein [Mortierella sp. GBAus27b]|nr:PAC2 family-domain-containing protein [Mortierella sp. GBAus27b]
MNNFVPSPGFDATRLKGTTLILPSVSIGNVPQLTTDLLLATLALDRIGCIEDENVVPVVGPADRPHESSSSASAGATPTLSLAVEVFQSKDGKWTVIQQRSPTVRHRSHHYVDNLVQFIKDAGFGLVVVLASADGARRIDIQLRSSSPVRYVSSPALSKELLETIKGLGIEQLENVPRIPNGGIARRLHSLSQEQEIPILSIVKFAMEGDNAPDAIFLANVLNTIFKVYVPNQQQAAQGEGWKFPKSWDSLYGNTFHQDMYQ